MTPQRQLEERIARLERERSYCMPGLHVPVRRVRLPGQSLGLSLKAWLMYPLFSTQNVPQPEP